MVSQSPTRTRATGSKGRMAKVGEGHRSGANLLLAKQPVLPGEVHVKGQCSARSRSVIEVAGLLDRQLDHLL